MRFWIEPDGDPSTPDEVGELFELVRDEVAVDAQVQNEKLGLHVRELQYKLERERIGNTELENEVIKLRRQIANLNDRPLYTEVVAKLDREVEAHRQNCEALAQMTSRAIAAEDKLVLISHSFMELHNIAKAVVGPKVDKSQDVSTSVPFKWTQGCPGGPECICAD